MLRGPAARVQEFADRLIAARGVRYGTLNLISAESTEPHDCDGSFHRHLAPRD